MKSLLKFSATWCTPCQQLSSLLSTVELKDIDLVEVDVDTDVETTAKYRVRGVPTLILVEGDIELARTTGSKTKVELEKFIRGNYNS